MSEIWLIVLIRCSEISNFIDSPKIVSPFCTVYRFSSLFYSGFYSHTYIYYMTSLDISLYYLLIPLIYYFYYKWFIYYSSTSSFKMPDGNPDLLLLLLVNLFDSSLKLLPILELESFIKTSGIEMVFNRFWEQVIFFDLNIWVLSNSSFNSCSMSRASILEALELSSSCDHSSWSFTSFFYYFY